MGKKKRVFAEWYDDLGIRRFVWWICAIMQLGGLWLIFTTPLIGISLLLIIVSGFGFYLDSKIDEWCISRD
jgi:hypothetical protein